MKMPAPQPSSSSNPIPPPTPSPPSLCSTSCPSDSSVLSFFLSRNIFLLFLLFIFFFFSIHPPLWLFSCCRKTSGTGSPDSVLKKSLLPSSRLYPTTPSSTSSSSASSRTDCSSLGGESHPWTKHLSSSKGCLSRTTSYPVSSSIELISRGPDGRFLTPAYENDTTGPRSGKVRRSVSLLSERTENKEPPFVLSVDLPPSDLAEDVPAKYLPHLESKAGLPRFPDLSRVCSNSSLAAFSVMDRKHAPSFPVLPHIRCGLGQPTINASALVLQMEHEREKGNLSHCLKLAQEREELEKELRRYTLERSSTRQQHLGLEGNGRGDSELMWEYKSRTLPHRHALDRKQRPVLSASNFSTPTISWESTVPDLTYENMSLRQSATPSTMEPWLRGEAVEGSTDRWTLPRRSSNKHKKVETALGGGDDSSQTDDACSGKREHPGRGAISMLSFHAERSDLAHGDEKRSVEMSVDEPGLEESVKPSSRVMLHHRIASHLRNGSSPSNGSWCEDVRSVCFNKCDSTFGGGPNRSPPPDSWLELLRVPGSAIRDPALRSRSLDLRRQEDEFLTPDAWINSLSQENCSLLSSHHLSSLFLENQAPSSRTISKSPTEFPSTTQPAPLEHSPSPLENSESLPPRHRTSPNPDQTHPAETRDCSENGSMPALQDNHLDVLEMEAGSYGGVPQSGSYSSYASSGRGSMGPPHGRLSVCQLPASLAASPATTEEIQGGTDDLSPHRYPYRPIQRRKFKKKKKKMFFLFPFGEFLNLNFSLCFIISSIFSTPFCVSAS